MFNLVGEENKSGDVVYKGLENVFAEKNTFLHIYGKTITRPNRKMGHITIVSDENIKEKIFENNTEKLLEKAKKLKETVKVTI